MRSGCFNPLTTEGHIWTDFTPSFPAVLKWLQSSKGYRRYSNTFSWNRFEFNIKLIWIDLIKKTILIHPPVGMIDDIRWPASQLWTFYWRCCTISLRTHFVHLYNNRASQNRVQTSSSKFNVRDPDITHKYETRGIRVCKHGSNTGWTAASQQH